MKGILYFFWGFVLLGLLNVAWFAANFPPIEKAREQAQQFDNYMFSRGQYGSQR